MAAVHGPRGPFSVSQYKDEQRCGGMALPAERQGEPWPAESLPPDSAAAQRVLAGRRQREDAVGMWHDAFTEEREQQAALQTPAIDGRFAPLTFRPLDVSPQDVIIVTDDWTVQV